MAKNLANIWSYAGDEPILRGKVRLVDGTIRFEGFSAKYLQSFHRGIVSPVIRNPRGKVFPSAGRPFLDALPFAFSGSMVRAELVEE